jgi:hypothetical protein
MSRMSAACCAAQVQVRAAGVQRAGRRPPDGGLWPSGYTEVAPVLPLFPYPPGNVDSTPCRPRPSLAGVHP